MLYIAILILFVFLYVCFFLYDEKFSKYLFLFFSLFFGAFSGTRYGIGTDYFSYQRIFGEICFSGFDSDQYDIGFYFLNHIFCYFGYEYLILFTSVFISICFFYITFNLSRSPIFSLIYSYLMLIPFFSYNGIRQGISIAIFQIAVIYLFKTRVLHYLITVFSSIFHKSALILLIVNISTSRITYIKFKIILCIFMVCCIWTSYFVSPTILMDVFDINLGGYDFYLDSDYSISSQGSGFFVILWAVLVSFFIFKYLFQDKVTNLLVINSFFAVLATNMGFYIQIFLRLEPYFSWAKPILITNLIFSIKNIKTRLFFLGLFLIYCIYTYYNGYTMNLNGIFPYQNIFVDKK